MRASSMSNAKKCLALPDSNRSPLAGDGQLAVRVPNAESIAIKHEYESPPCFRTVHNKIAVLTVVDVVLNQYRGMDCFR